MRLWRHGGSTVVPSAGGNPSTSDLSQVPLTQACIEFEGTPVHSEAAHQSHAPVLIDRKTQKYCLGTATGPCRFGIKFSSSASLQSV
jgi:hypothetical protein